MLNSNVLELGTGAGANISLFLQQGLSYYGIEGECDGGRVVAGTFS
ncbi:hypothetical protein [Candidatus Endoriftia persephonae]|jgi:hypothetical protein|uniref:Methyltransferase type 11 n=2 Tax=Gammaproteobacteria TaxID=1236 RepID=G2FB58_9GAMM|nr:hypothetical protein [Candidatus Endoriftia persephone]EGW55996.1 hypothetical protein TevJSym_aa01400 [endosymbiont of Tevnia jerichonana (vent Tica)]USF88124.1 class I SAM-dependent methyltransferase [Candidatus Endoriftia persephone]